MQTIAVDLMSGDYGPRFVFSGIDALLAKHPKMQLLLVGEYRELKDLRRRSSFASRMEILDAPDVFLQDDNPRQILRRKETSLYKTIESVQLGQADAMVSAANTGALLIGCNHLLPLVEGMKRPALTRQLPGPKQPKYLLDLGSNADCEPEHIVQFAKLGASICRHVHHLPNPRVALLNIGSESHKGNSFVRSCERLLVNLPEYGGFVEASDLYNNPANVIVTDGFTGNILIKGQEALFREVKRSLLEWSNQNLFNKGLAMALSPAVTWLSHQFSPTRYNGAILAGLRRVVIKSHGSADAFAFAMAIEQSYEWAKSGVFERLDL